MMQALLPVLLVGLLSACANIESNKPDIDSRFQNTTFKPLVSPGAVQAPTDWWTAFSSTQLTTLMQQAQADNLNLEATAARLRAAQASLNAAQAGFFPALNLNASRQENTVKGVSIQGQATNNRGLFTSA